MHVLSTYITCIHNIMYIPCVDCTNCNTEDYGLEILFLECWSRASEMDFFEVQCHTLLCNCIIITRSTPVITLFVCVLCLNSFGTTQFQSGSTAVSSLSTLHMVSDINFTFLCVRD